MTDDELREKVMEKLDLTEGPDPREWIDLQIQMREKAKRLSWIPLFDPLHEPNGNVYYRRTSPDGIRLTEEDFKQAGVETTYFNRQEHGQYQAEALAFLEIFKLTRLD